MVFQKTAITIVLLGVGGAICRSQMKQKAGYVDPGLCAGCHRKISEDYARTGMGRSFRSAQAVALPEFNGAEFYHGASEQYFTPYRKDGRYYLRRRQTGFDGSAANVLESEVHYVFGSGNHARSYLHGPRPER